MSELINAFLTRIPCICVSTMLTRHQRKMTTVFFTVALVTAAINQTFFIHKVEAVTISRNSTAATAVKVNPANTAGNVFKVEAGRGDTVVVQDQFFPKKTEIKVGQNITWYNPTLVAEPHTVTFVLDNKSMTGVVAPFSFPNSTQFVPLNHSLNSQPTLVPSKDGINAVVGLNARAFKPVAIDSKDNVKVMSPNSHYTMTGGEKYVNSGWLIPKGLEQSFPGSANTFTVIFEKAGTYNYACLIHPWMKGAVIVK